MGLATDHAPAHAAQALSHHRAVADPARSEERYALAVRAANDGIWDWDLVTDTMYCSPRWHAILGRPQPEGDQPAATWFDLVHPADLERVRAAVQEHLAGRSPQLRAEHRMRHADGGWRWVLTRGLASRGEDGRPARMAGSMSDVTDRRLAQQRLQHDALHDSLNGLPNRTLFMDRVHQTLQRLRRDPRPACAVLFMDVDPMPMETVENRAWWCSTPCWTSTTSRSSASPPATSAAWRRSRAGLRGGGRSRPRSPEPEHTRDVFGQVCSGGVGLHLDDFGTGYSSLSALPRFPVDALKIDRSFVAELGSDEDGSEVIIRSTVAMAHSLGLPVIAEGIEAPGQLRRLRSLGCEFGQGHLFSPALSGAEMADLLARWSPAEIVTLFSAA